METIYLSRETPTPVPCVATVGFFDGVHCGHRYVVQQVTGEARRRGLASAVVTFARHPRQVLQADYRSRLLTTLDEKCALFQQTGIDRLLVLSFDRAMAALTAQEFMERVLQAQLGVSVLVTGYDNHFGHRLAGSTEGFDDYAAYGRRMGMELLRAAAFDTQDIRVSSSKVRRLLGAGDVATAACCLGRPYRLTGRVVAGRHLGTTLGFPTANLQPSDADKLVPAAGVYAVSATIDGRSRRLPGVTNIGHCPTFGGRQLTIETHLIDFNADLYGGSLTLDFVARLRPERRFQSGEALAAQMGADVRQALNLIDKTVTS